MYESRVVSQAVNADAARAYAFARREENLPAWASGLAAGVQHVGGRWFADSPMGRVEIEMAPDNPYGVLDHKVTLPDGQVVHNALRVTPNNEGCIFVFVVLRMAGSDEKAFAADVSHVEKDLRALAQLLERQGG